MSIGDMYPSIETFADKTCGAGATDDQIVTAERLLKVLFPESYRSFLKKVGWGEFSYERLYGLGADTPPYLNLVTITERERTDLSPQMPLHLIPVMNDGAGNNYCLDTSRMRAGECPIVVWDHELGPDQIPCDVAPSFDNWLIDLLASLSHG